MKTWSELAIENTRMREKLLQIEANFQAQLLQKDAAIQSKSSIIKSKDAFIEELKEALILARNRQFAIVNVLGQANHYAHCRVSYLMRQRWKLVSYKRPLMMNKLALVVTV